MLSTTTVAQLLQMGVTELLAITAPRMSMVFAAGAVDLAKPKDAPSSYGRSHRLHSQKIATRGTAEQRTVTLSSRNQINERKKATPCGTFSETERCKPRIDPTDGKNEVG